MAGTLHLETSSRVEHARLWKLDREPQAEGEEEKGAPLWHLCSACWRPTEPCFAALHISNTTFIHQKVLIFHAPPYSKVPQGSATCMHFFGETPWVPTKGTIGFLHVIVVVVPVQVVQVDLILGNGQPKT